MADILLFARADGEGLPPDTLAKLKEENLTPFVSRHIKLEYEYFTAEQILKVEIMSSLSNVLFHVSLTVVN
eukprot:4253178-Pyramimonas_sp.AAC.1